MSPFHVLSPSKYNIVFFFDSLLQELVVEKALVKSQKQNFLVHLIQLQECFQQSSEWVKG